MPVENNILELMPNFVKKHWDYEKNNKSPEEVSIYSKEKYYWKNETSSVFHFEPSKIHSSLINTSIPEQSIFYYMNKFFKDAVSRHVFICDNKKYEADIYIPSIALVIEYDGGYHHGLKERLERDLRKNQFFNSIGLFCIRAREKGLPELPEFYGCCVNAKGRYDNSDTINAVVTKTKDYITECYPGLFLEQVRKLSHFVLSEEEYNNSLKDIYKLLCIEPIASHSCEAIVNFYEIHKNDLYNESTLESFVNLWEYCDYSDSPFKSIKDINFIQEIAKIKVLYFFDFSIFMTKDAQRWLYNYWMNLIENDSETVHYFEHTIYKNLELNLIAKLEKGEYIWDEDILLKKGLNITNDILNMMQLFCKIIIQKHPTYYRRWVYEKIVYEIDKYLRYKN